jgi:AraC family transcriptional regulator, positive regulator of tynA and feaB
VDQGPSDTILRWSTTDVPQASRLDYFAAALSSAVVPLGVDKADPATFRAELSYTRLDTIGIAKTLGSPHESFRRATQLAQTRGRSFNLLMTLDTPWTAEHRGCMRLLPRDILIYDSEYPLQIDVGRPFSAVCIAVSEDWFRRWLPNPGVLVARRIVGQSAWGRALSALVGELTPEMVAATSLPTSLLADQVGGMLALTANAIRGSEAAEFTPAIRSLHERIVDCLQQRCTEPDLTAPQVASGLNISLRTLHRTLAAAGETFGARLIDARARVAERMLASPLFNRVTTAEIGRRAGFTNASHFARVIRHRTGLTPMQWRRARM